MVRARPSRHKTNDRWYKTLAFVLAATLASTPWTSLAVVGAAAAWFGAPPPGFWPAIAAAAVLAAVSWIDDLRSLPVVLRLAVQALGVGIGIATLANAGPVFQGLLPPLLDRLAVGLLWLWLVKQFTFMDGIDGIAGVEAGSFGIGLGGGFDFARGTRGKDSTASASELGNGEATWRGRGGDRGEPVAWQAASRAL